MDRVVFVGSINATEQDAKIHIGKRVSKKESMQGQNRNTNHSGFFLFLPFLLSPFDFPLALPFTSLEDLRGVAVEGSMQDRLNGSTRSSMRFRISRSRVVSLNRASSFFSFSFATSLARIVCQLVRY
jgi:hypothetical protein